MELEALFTGGTIATLLWQTTFWLVAGLTAAAFARRQPARGHALLLAALAGAVLTPVAGLICQRAGWGLLPPLATLLGGAETAPFSEAPGRLARSGGFDATMTLAAGWGAVSGLLLVRLVFAAHRARTMIRRATAWSDPTVLAPARAACAALGVASMPAVMRTSAIRSPMIWCWGRRPTILFPATPGLDDGERLYGILCHELAHLQRRDHVAALAAEIGSCLLFWHPLVWVARRRLRHLSEQACDGWVLAAGVAPHQYADALLGLLPTLPPRLALAAVSGRRGLVARIDRILREPVAPPWRGRRFAATAIATTVLVMSVTALAQRRAAVPEPPLVLEVSAQPPIPAVLHGAVPAGGLAAVPGEIDLGRSAPGATVLGAVWLVNDSPSAVRILSARASCGCTTVGAFEPTNLGPGERMRFDLSMTAPKESGVERTKYVTFTIEDHEPLRVPLFIATEAAST